MKKCLLSLAITQVLMSSAYANVEVVEAEAMETIEVTAVPFSQKMGTQILSAEQISKLPTGNGSLTELLKHNPNVQFSNASNSSLSGGELEPETVSFHGEKFYNNNFMIDGLSNNNNIDPITTSGTAGKRGDLASGYNAWDLPAGGEQSLWIDSGLIDSLEVFDSNISAKYGNFTGGVIDAKIKNPDLKRASGRVSWRSTRDSWAKFHIDETVREDFEQATYLYYQPQFTKNFYSVSVNQPLSERAGVILSYNRAESEIPTYQSWADTWRNQQRLSETYLLKGSYQADSDDFFSVTAMYAPHSTSLFRRGIKDGGFDNTGGGYRFNVDWKHDANWGKVKTTLGYQYDENNINNEADHYYPWYHKYRNQQSSMITWATSALSRVGTQTGLQGGYGDYATEKKNITLKQDYTLNDFNLWDTKHQVNLGWEYNHEDVDYQRFADATLGGTTVWNTSVVCQEKDDGCITGEQYTSLRLLYPARQVAINMNRYALYAEDNIRWKRLELTPGVRITHDDFTKNTTISPRFSFTTDVFGDENTRLFGGWSRYYANHIYAYKLKNKISSYIRQSRSMNADGTLTDWVGTTAQERSSSKYNYDPSNLDTPYTDEINVGIAQKFADTLWTLKWVNRDSKKSYARSQTKNENGEYVMDNSGWSKADTISLTAQPLTPFNLGFMDLNWSINAQWSKRKNNTANDYDTTSEDDFTKVIYENKVINQADLPAFDYHTPWSLRANIDMLFPNLNLTWGHSLAYQAGYTGYKTSSQECPVYDSAVCGDYVGTATLYEKTRFDDYLTYDMRLAYKQPVFKNQSLEVTLDITNALNKTIASSATTSSTSQQVTYKMGRQFWLGVAYNW